VLAGEILSLRRAPPFAWQKIESAVQLVRCSGTCSPLVRGVVGLCYAGVVLSGLVPFWSGGQQYRFWVKSVSGLAAIQL
jgi:hypothetical protein